MIEIDPSAAQPLTDQIAAAIRTEIAAGRLSIGDELPTVRQLSGDLEVNFNTVARAYRALEACGLLRSARGRGTRVVATVETDTRRAKRTMKRSLARALADARLAGLNRFQIETVLGREIDLLWPKEEQT